jgi:L-ascorbate metabolism protein UlaG (beta-lactamase superfamily)
MKAVFAPSSLLCLAMVSRLATAAPAEQPPRDVLPTASGDLSIVPINHATLALVWSGKTIIVDPVGDQSRYAGLETPAIILLTDIHGDHFNKATLTTLAGAQTRIVAPPAVAEQLPADLRERATIMTNAAKTEVAGVQIEAMPAYNLTAERLKFHSQGRGNGYVLTLGGKRIYLSGDTEGIPEMRALKDIDVAFVCMNLPYTMDVNQAAQAVRAFKPKIVYPYHCRGSDLNQFKELVGTSEGIEVRIRDWYAAGAR